MRDMCYMLQNHTFWDLLVTTLNTMEQLNQDLEEYHLLGYKAVYSFECQRTFACLLVSC
jgi:hypothetical protein